MKVPALRANLFGPIIISLFFAAPAWSDTFTFDATLFENYGTISAGDTLSGTLTLDDTTGSVVSIVIGHATAGDFTTSSGPTNVFNNAFGGGVDAVAFQGLGTTGTLAGVVASSSVNLDLRGPNNVIFNTLVPTDADTLNRFDQRILQVTSSTAPGGSTGVADIGCINRVGSSVIYSFVADLIENYGTLNTGDVLQGVLTIDSSSGTVNCITVTHVTEGSFRTLSGPINVFDNAFGGGVDVTVYQGLSAAGTLGGVVGSSSLNLDLRGPNTVISSSSVETDVNILNLFDQRTLQMTSPTFPGSSTGVATISPFALLGVTTPAGTNVFVEPVVVDDDGFPIPDPPAIDLTFDDISASGTTSVTVVDLSDGPTAPTSFQISGDDVYYDIETTTDFNENVLVCIGFDDIGDAAEQMLVLYHFTGGVWNDITASVNTVENFICGNASSFSIFAILTPTGPTADAGSDQTVNEIDTVILNGNASTNASTYVWTQIAIVMGTPVVSLDGADLSTASFVAPYVDGDTPLTFKLEVSDGTSTSDDVVNITVKSANDRPVADAGDDNTIKEGAVATLDGVGSFDPDGDPISFSWTQTGGPAVTLADAGTATPQFTAPALSVGQVFVFGLVVSDDTLEPSLADDVAITIVANSAPAADAGANQTKSEGALVSLNGSATDPDGGDTLSYQWMQTSGTPVVLSDDLVLMPSFNAPLVNPGGEALVFSLVATDNDPINPLSSPADQVVISVTNVNDPPTCSLAVASPAQVWPPNHQLKAISINGVSDSDSQYNTVTLQVTGVTQDEPVDSSGDGNTSPDAVVQVGTPADSVLVRSERAGSGNGRIYVISFTADDGLESCTGTVNVSVPKKKRKVAIDDGQLYDSTMP